MDNDEIKKDTDENRESEVDGTVADDIESPAAPEDDIAPEASATEEPLYTQPQQPQQPQPSQPTQPPLPQQPPYYVNPMQESRDGQYYDGQPQPQPQPQSPQQQQQQPPRSQWSFNDYGPLETKSGGKSKQSKAPKSKKQNGIGVKVLAVCMSVLFLVTASVLGVYVLNDIKGGGKNNSPLLGGDGGSSASSQENLSGSPAMDIQQTPDSPQGGAAANGSLTTKEIYKKVSPAVVGIAVYTKQMGEVLQGEGSGVIMNTEGYVVTNNHVVSSDRTNPIVKIEVILPNGETHDAKLIGGDSKTDLAVLKITAENLVAAEFGDSDKLAIGDRVVVIGNPSGVQFAGSLTQGVVSALNRNVYMSELRTELEFIQTDAAINPGNSGGAFVNEYGQVVGISSAKMMVSAGYEGMGFAIPINNAKDVVDSLIKNGYVSGRPKIGIDYVPISETIAYLSDIPKGLRVQTVDPNFDAYKKGIVVGDIITKMDGNEVYDTQTVGEALKNKKPNDEIALTVYHVDETGKSSTRQVTVVLGEAKS